MKLLLWIAGVAIILVLSDSMPKWAGWMLLLVVLYIMVTKGVK